MTQTDIEFDLCKRDFRFFLGYCFVNFLHKKFMFYKFHNELIDIVLSCESHKRMIINAPPRLGKTVILEFYMAWRFLNNPASTMIYVSYDEKLVGRKNREIKDMLAWLSKHFNVPELRMLHQANGKTEWVNKANGSIIARGSNNAITGSGCETLLVVDDPNKPNDRTSPSTLAKRNSTFISTVRNRIDNINTPIIVIQQRIASADLSGFLLDDGSHEKWEHYNFPAIGTDGAALCPERLPVDEVEKYKSDPFTYNAQYLQVPLDDIGNLFDKNHLVLDNVRPPNNAMRIIISIDASSKGDIKADYNAISVIGRKGPDYYVLEVCNFHADITLLIEKTREIRKKWGSNTPVLFEAKANGIPAVQILRKEMSGILEVSPCKDKIERAMMTKFLFDSLNVHFTLRGLVWGEIQTQFTQFPHCRHDDIVDSICQGITWLNQLPDRDKQLINKIDAETLSRPRLGRYAYAGSGYNPARRF